MLVGKHVGPVIKVPDRQYHLHLVLTTLKYSVEDATFYEAEPPSANSSYFEIDVIQWTDEITFRDRWKIVSAISQQHTCWMHFRTTHPRTPLDNDPFSSCNATHQGQLRCDRWWHKWDETNANV